MTAVFVVVTLLVIVAIALVSVGRVTFSLAAQPPPTFFDVDEAVVFVAERLPDHVTARLSYDELRQLLDWHVDYLLTTGVAATREGELIVLSAEGAPPVIAADDEGIAYVLGKVAAHRASLVRGDHDDADGGDGDHAEGDHTDGDDGGEGAFAIDDVTVVEVLEAEGAYLRAIGALGTEVPAPLDPGDEPSGS